VTINNFKFGKLSDDSPVLTQYAAPEIWLDGDNLMWNLIENATIRPVCKRFTLVDVWDRRKRYRVMEPEDRHQSRQRHLRNPAAGAAQRLRVCFGTEQYIDL
jgi:hypothetical protein